MLVEPTSNNLQELVNSNARKEILLLIRPTQEKGKGDQLIQTSAEVNKKGAMMN